MKTNLVNFFVKVKFLPCYYKYIEHTAHDQCVLKYNLSALERDDPYLCPLKCKPN